MRYIEEIVVVVIASFQSYDAAASKKYFSIASTLEVH